MCGNVKGEGEKVYVLLVFLNKFQNMREKSEGKMWLTQCT